MLKRLLLGLSIFLGSIFILIITLYLILPEDLIRDGIIRYVEKGGGLGLSIEGLHKGPLLTFKARGVSILQRREAKEPFIYIEELMFRLNSLDLVLGRLTLPFWGSAGKGGIRGKAGFKNGQRYVSLNLDRVGVEAFPSLMGLGFEGGRIKGELDVKIRGGCPTGAFRLEAIEPRIPRFPKGLVPGNGFKRLWLNAVLDNCKVDVKTLSGEGDDIYVKASGSLSIIEPFPVDITLEVFPKKGDKGLLSALGGKKVSSSHYTVSIRGTLSHLQFSR